MNPNKIEKLIEDVSAWLVAVGFWFAVCFVITIALMTSVSAYYPGETIQVANEFGTEDLVYTLIDNSTPIDLQLVINTTNISIKLPGNLAPQSFQIILLESQTKEIIKEIRVSSGGSGGTRTKWRDKIIYENKTEYIEVPKYINSTEYINITKEVPSETSKRGKRLWAIIVICLVLITAALIYRIVKGGNKNEGTKEEIKQEISSI